jgi:hypothetical protein
VDLELSARDDDTWHLSVYSVVTDDLGPVSK